MVLKVYIYYLLVGWGEVEKGWREEKAVDV
jgi:hypothetical protein